MSLYYEAAAILANPDNAGGSVKSRIYGKKTLKSSPAHLYALISEATKWSVVLKEVVEKSGILKEEKKVDGLLLYHSASQRVVIPTSSSLCLIIVPVKHTKSQHTKSSWRTAVLDQC